MIYAALTTHGRIKLKNTSGKFSSWKYIRGACRPCHQRSVGGTDGDFKFVICTKTWFMNAWRLEDATRLGRGSKLQRFLMKLWPLIVIYARVSWEVGDFQFLFINQLMDVDTVGFGTGHAWRKSSPFTAKSNSMKCPFPIHFSRSLANCFCSTHNQTNSWASRKQSNHSHVDEITFFIELYLSDEFSYFHCLRTSSTKSNFFRLDRMQMMSLLLLIYFTKFSIYHSLTSHLASHR